jgi:hypothetical protein
MKQLLYVVLAFGLGVIVGTTGSDDSLIDDALHQESTAYQRGFQDAHEKFQAVAHQLGFASFAYDPQTGQRVFVWVASPHARDRLLEDATPAVASTDRLDQPDN